MRSVNVMTETKTDYESFIRNKSQSGTNSGFTPTFLPEFLFDFQRHLVDWAIRKGRAALFERLRPRQNSAVSRMGRERRPPHE